jgi:hypothetical protein
MPSLGRLLVRNSARAVAILTEIFHACLFIPGKWCKSAFKQIITASFHILVIYISAYHSTL